MSLTSVEDRFCQLLTEHGKIVVKVANTYAFHFEDRRDLVQEINAQLWRAFSSYDEGRSFTTWMYRLCLNVAVSQVRREQKRERGEAQLDSTIAEQIADPTEGREEDHRLELHQRFMRTLGQLDKALLLLYLEDRSYREIADIIGISETNVATKIARLKQRALMDAMGVSLLKEVIPQVERTYLVASTAKGRAIAGCSMGGAQALYFGLNHPDLFGAIGSFSGAFIMYSGAVDAWFPKLPGKRQPDLLVACGKADFLAGSNRNMVAWLKSHGVSPTVWETPGWHTWNVWPRNLAEFVPSLFK